jgi:hypothetical protein
VLLLARGSDNVVEAGLGVLQSRGFEAIGACPPGSDYMYHDPHSDLSSLGMSRRSSEAVGIRLW